MYGCGDEWLPVEKLWMNGIPLDSLCEIEARIICGESVDSAMQSVLCETYKTQEVSK